MTEAEKDRKKPKGLEEIGKVFTLDFNIVEEFVEQSSIDKLQEILKEEIRVAGFFMALPKSKKIILLMALPEDKEKTMLVVHKEEDAERIYEALASLKKG